MNHDVVDAETRLILKDASIGFATATPGNFVQPSVRFYKTTGQWFWKKFHYLLERDYAFIWESAPGIEKMVVKRAPYDYDKASTPKFAVIFGHYSYGPSEAASLFHDDGYEKEGEYKNGRFEYYVRVNGGEWKRDDAKWSRRELDDFYRMVCECGGMTAFDARVEWLAVRGYPPNLLKKF